MLFFLLCLSCSYAGLGWRPTSASKSCQKWPLIEDSEKNLAARSLDIDNVNLNLYPSAEGVAEGKGYLIL